MLSPSEGGASRWHKAQNGRSLQSILSGDQIQDGAASSPMSLKWVWILKKDAQQFDGHVHNSQQPQGWVWEMVGFGAHPKFWCSDASFTSFFLIICMQECAPGRTFSLILEGKRVGKWSP